MASQTPAIPESLPPHELRNALKRTLKETLDRMDSDEFVFAQDTLNEEERNAAMIARGGVFRAWRKLNNEDLDAIRDQLVANEPELRTATASLEQSLKDLSKVTQVVNTVNAFLAVATKALTIL